MSGFKGWVAHLPDLEIPLVTSQGSSQESA
jgi:hypothetical protein